MHKIKCAIALSLALALPATALAVSVTSPANLGSTDFWAYAEATNGALARVEERGPTPATVNLIDPTVGGIALTGNLSAYNLTSITGPTTTVNAQLAYNGDAAFNTDIDLRSLVTFDVAAFGPAGTASVGIVGSGIGGVTGNVFGQFGQASAVVSGYVTLYETTISGGFGAIVDSWYIPGGFVATPINDVVTLNTNELYKVIVRSNADIRLFNIDAFNLTAYMIVDPTFTSLTEGVTVAVSPGAAPVVPLPAALWLFATALGLLGWVRRKTA
jgi:hypothetical protein